MTQKLRAKVRGLPGLGIVGFGSGFGVSWLEVKLGVRMMGKEPLLTAVAILTLAIGIPTS